MKHFKSLFCIAAASFLLGVSPGFAELSSASNSHTGPVCEQMSLFDPDTRSKLIENFGSLPLLYPLSCENVESGLSLIRSIKTIQVIREDEAKRVAQANAEIRKANKANKQKELEEKVYEVPFKVASDENSPTIYNFSTCQRMVSGEGAKAPSVYELCAYMENKPIHELSKADRINSIIAAATRVKSRVPDFEQIPAPMMACLAARESAATFSPNLVQGNNCDGAQDISFQIGFGQIEWRTFLQVILGFKSEVVNGAAFNLKTQDDRDHFALRALRTILKIPGGNHIIEDKLLQPFDEPVERLAPEIRGDAPALTTPVDLVLVHGDVEGAGHRHFSDPMKLSAAELYDAMTTNPELQVEIMLRVYHLKLIAAQKADSETRDRRSELELAAAFYNGGDSQRSYGSAVNSCFTCLNRLFPPPPKPKPPPKTPAKPPARAITVSTKRAPVKAVPVVKEKPGPTDEQIEDCVKKIF